MLDGAFYWFEGVSVNCEQACMATNDDAGSSDKPKDCLLNLTSSSVPVEMGLAKKKSGTVTMNNPRR